MNDMTPKVWKRCFDRNKGSFQKGPEAVSGTMLATATQT